MDDYGFLFVNDVPLFYEKKRLARQIQVETWLDLAGVLKELGIDKVEQKPIEIPNNSKGYVV